jgi:integrase
MKLTIRSIATIKPGERETVYWDDDLPCFGLRVRASGDRSFIVQYRNKYRRVRKMTLGRPGNEFPPEKARKEAERVLGRVREGVDPAEEKKQARTALTVAELADRYLEQHAEAKKRPSSVRMDKANLRLHVRPRIGNMPVASITRADISGLHHAMKDTPGAANRVLALLSKMFNLAEQWDIRSDGSNPCRHVERYRERMMERFLSGEEIGVLGEVLSYAENTQIEPPSVVAAIRLLMFTGARLGEILGLRWEHVDFERCRLALPESKTGAKTIYLSAPALEILHGLNERKSGPWVIKGRDPGKPLVNLRKPWYRIRERTTLRLWVDHPDPKVSGLVAKLRDKHGHEPTYRECFNAARAEKVELPTGLADVRLHDLRHSFASVGAASGLSLPMIGALLGHSQPVTTQRYAHLAADPVKAAADVIGERIAAAMKPKKEGKVIELNKA